MLDHRVDFDQDIAGLGGLPAEAWRARMAELGQARGYFQPLGPDHSALFVAAGPRLLVTFEDAEIVRRRGGRPVGLDMVAQEGWSLLAILAEGPTWFRSQAVIQFFDDRVDEASFEAFDAVLFYGCHMGAYGAAAYSVVAPGCHVLMLRPVASLAPSLAGWDRRDLKARRFDFASRYGYGPDMIEAAARAWTVHDPLHPMDATHAALYRRPHVVGLQARHAGAYLPRLLDAMDATYPLLEAAMAGRLDALSWGRLWRGRRYTKIYPRLLLHRAERGGRRAHLLRLCRVGLHGPDAAFFEAKAAQYRLALTRLDV